MTVDLDMDTAVWRGVQPSGFAPLMKLCDVLKISAAKRHLTVVLSVCIVQSDQRVGSVGPQFTSGILWADIASHDPRRVVERIGKRSVDVLDARHCDTGRQKTRPTM